MNYQEEKLRCLLGQAFLERQIMLGGKTYLLKDVAFGIGLDVEQEKDLITLAEYYTRDNQRTKITEAIKAIFA